MKPTEETMGTDPAIDNEEAVAPDLKIIQQPLYVLDPLLKKKNGGTY